jgi:hypothetical protein
LNLGLGLIVIGGFFRLRSDVKKIVQRDGLAFHWPQEEQIEAAISA